MSNTRGRTSGDARARIADAHDSLIRLQVGGEPDAAAWGRELHGVVQNIREDLVEPRAITVDPNRRGRRLHVHRLPGGRGLGVIDSTAVAINDATSSDSRRNWILLAVIRDTSSRSSTSRTICAT